VPKLKTTLPPIVWKESPNQSARVHGAGSIRLIVVHTPEGAYEPMVKYLCRASSQVSYHGLLREDGLEFTQLVPWDRKAWHAKAYNSLSEGISAAGFARSFNVESEQARRLARIVAYRLHKRGLPARWSRDGGGEGVTRHADLQSDRSDPMSVQKWEKFMLLVKAEYKRGGFRQSWGRTR
jgi:N-acetyl-anhydromuramyl-L-alanine amidase AmpD